MKASYTQKYLTIKIGNHKNKRGKMITYKSVNLRTRKEILSLRQILDYQLLLSLKILFLILNPSKELK